MDTPSPDAIVQELLARGVSPDDIAAANPTLGARAQSGLIAPRIAAPDKIAERGAFIKDYSQVNKDREELGKFYSQGQDLDRFHDLNTQASTGFWDAVPLGEKIHSAFNPAVSELSSITSGLQGRVRPPGSGATSDFEQRLYRQGVPSPEKQGPTNDSIIAYQKGVLGEQRDRLAFQEEFMRRNGSLSGSQDAWARYVASNPYTVTGEGGRSALNPRRADWRQYFGLGGAPQQQAKPPAAPQRPAGWVNKLPKTQLQAAMMFKGSTGPVGSPKNPYVPASAAEFKNLPVGAHYIDDDGKIYRKGAR
jgi:hypothetical protein